MKNNNINLYLFLIIFIFIGCSKNPVTSEPSDFILKTTFPEVVGMNSQLLHSAHIQAESTGFIDGLLVIRRGYIVSERYYNGFNINKPHNVMSVSKSFLSAITGLALEREYIDSLDEKVLDYFPEYIYPEIDPRKYDITIKHLLTMRMGIKGEAEDNYGVYWGLYNSDNWMKTTIESPLIYDPGQRMRYNTFQTHLLSGIITKATSKSTLDFAKENLFDPMKIDVDSWEQDPQGYYFGGNSMYFTPREMALLGYLYLNNGKINDLQIIPKSWIEFTLSASSDFTHPNAWGAWKNYNYAYLWWLGQINEYDMFIGYGYGGQFIVVFPSLNLIIVTTAKHEVDSDSSTIQEWAIFDIIANYILPSINN